MFADLFPAGPYLGGEELGALDIHAAVVSKWSDTRKHLEAHRRELYATLLRVEAHPKVAAVFAEHWPKT
jgi:GST-like protein